MVALLETLARCVSTREGSLPELFFIDEHGFKRPKPPPLYIEFKDKYKYPDELPKSQRGHTINYHVCPNCGIIGQASCGKGGAKFVDPQAQKFCDELPNRGTNLEFDDFCTEYEGDMIKCHWSRYYTAERHCCGVQLWEDGIEGYIKGTTKYVGASQYYLPKPYDVKAIVKRIEEERIEYRNKNTMPLPPVMGIEKPVEKPAVVKKTQTLDAFFS